MGSRMYLLQFEVINRDILPTRALLNDRFRSFAIDWKCFLSLEKNTGSQYRVRSMSRMNYRHTSVWKELLKPGWKTPLLPLGAHLHPCRRLYERRMEGNRKVPDAHRSAAQARHFVGCQRVELAPLERQTIFR